MARDNLGQTWHTVCMIRARDGIKRIDTAGPLWAWAILTLLFPFVGLVAGIVYLFRNQIGPGLALIVEAVATFAIWAVLLSSAQGATPQRHHHAPPKTRMSFVLAIAIAADFWSNWTDGRDPALHAAMPPVRTPCHPQPVPVSYATMRGWGDGGADMAAFAWPVACDVYMAPDGLQELRDAPAEFCADVTHEVGNIDGVPETDDAGWVTSLYFTDASVPRVCRHWHRWERQHWGSPHAARTDG